VVKIKELPLIQILVGGDAEFFSRPKRVTDLLQQTVLSVYFREDKDIIKIRSIVVVEGVV